VGRDTVDETQMWRMDVFPNCKNFAGQDIVTLLDRNRLWTA
jgi:hypothetical protein